MEVAITLVDAVVTWVFAVLVFRQYIRKRKLYQLVWTVGLVCFAIAVTAEFILVTRGGWTEPLYRTWYLFGAMLGVVFLGQGTAFLLTRPAVARAALVLVLLMSAAGAYVTLTAPVDLGRLEHPAEPSGKAFPAIKDAGPVTPRAWTPILNLYGTGWLVGGAAWSAYEFARRRARSNRVVGNALIAGGAFVVAGASALNRFGISGFQYVGELAGIILIFSGFLYASRPESSQVG